MSTQVRDEPKKGKGHDLPACCPWCGKDPQDKNHEHNVNGFTCWTEGINSGKTWLTMETRGNGHQPSASIPPKNTATIQHPPTLAGNPDILAEFGRAMAQSGVYGEEKGAKILYLAVTSRLLERPVSVAVKGTSSSGKSYLVEKTLSFFPPKAYYALSAMSEKALAYSQEPLSHRMLVIYEAAGMASELATYMIRSLLSEGKIRYETVDRGKDGLKPKLIEREGPTGLIVTTTQVKLHPENETRLLSITSNDSREQTANVLLSLATGGCGQVDMKPWHQLQAWLDDAEHRVFIPYAEALARKIPPVAVRLRRDFASVLSLIRAHAILHQCSRERGSDGSIRATFIDYEAIRELVIELVAEGVNATVSQTMRDTIEAVDELAPIHAEGVPVIAIAKKLNLDKSTVSRRVTAAIFEGYLKNLEDKKGRPARLFAGDPLPKDIVILPTENDLYWSGE